MTERHANISIFVPHIGCPNKCSFCNQRYITGVCKAPNANDVHEAVENAKKSPKFNSETTQIAFFGGSFTAINRNYMKTLLESAYEYVEGGVVSGIRISTRPDAITEEILNLLKTYGVTAIELGAQSLNDRVLKLNNRGHNVSQVVAAANLIKEYDFELGLQIMTGLYGDNDNNAVKTAEKVIEIKPQTVRIYPTLVLKGTDLAALFLDDKYKPQSLDEAIELSTKLYTMFTEADIKVIRLGLHSVEQEAFLAGPWHPAFSELCLSRIMLKKALEQLMEKGNYTIFVSKSDVSKMIGQKRSNIMHLESLGFNCSVKASTLVNEMEFKIERKV